MAPRMKLPVATYIIQKISGFGNSQAKAQEDGSAQPDADLQGIGIDPIAEKKLLRKLDWTLIPMFTIIYACSLLYRSAVFNARLSGLEKDLHLRKNDLHISSTIFWVAYLVASALSNLALKRIGSVWLASLVTAIGLVTLGSTWMTARSHLFLSRAFLGLMEGGVLAALLYILSRYYRKGELVIRAAFCFSLGPGLDGSLGGLLAYAFATVPDIGSISSWRKIFLVEGIVITGIGILLFAICPEDPSVSKLLNDDERKLVAQRMDADAVVKVGLRREKSTWGMAKNGLNRPTVYSGIGYMFAMLVAQGVLVTFPGLIRTRGTPTDIQLQVQMIPPFAASTIWSTFNAYVSVRSGKRYPYILFNCLLSLAAGIIGFTTRTYAARYASCALMIFTGAALGPMVLATVTKNATPDTARALVSGFVPAIGALGPIMTVWSYPENDDESHFHLNYEITIVASVLMFIFFAVAARRCHSENRAKATADSENNGVLQGMGQEDLELLGTGHPHWRYQI